MTSNTSGLTRLAGLVTLVIGVATGIIALAAPAGVWFGVWTFQTGFMILFNPNGISITAIAPWLALAALAATVFVFVRDRNTGLRNAKLALCGTLAAGLAWYIPTSHQPGAEDNIPPIHDISTDTLNPPVFVDVLPLRANAANTAVYGGGPNETPESLAAMQRGAYPDIVTQRFAEPVEEIFARAMQAVGSLGWDLVAEVPEEGRIEATDTTFWFRFKDDIVIRIAEDSNGTLLDARSVSRVGRGDAGTNAKRLRNFFAEL